MTVLTDLLDDIQALVEDYHALQSEVEQLRSRVATLETEDGGDGGEEHPHIQHYRAPKWDAPAQEQGSYTGAQFQRPDGTLGAEFVYDVRDDHVELYTSKNAEGERVKRWSVDSSGPDTFINFDTDRGHKEYRRVKTGGIYRTWLLDNHNFDGHAVLWEEYDPATGAYRKWAPKTGETFVETNLLPEKKR